MFDLTAEIHLSDRFYDLITQRRIWNRIEKESLQEELVKHHEQRIPARFRQDARGTYHHQPRQPGYMAYKRAVYKSATDLVKAGLTENRVTRQRQIRVEGSATGSKTRGPGLVGHLKMQFPYPVMAENQPGRVQIDQMRNEITATTDGEQNDIATGWGHRCVVKFNAYLAGRRRFYRSA